MGGTFVAAAHGGVNGTVAYEVVLTATDASGLSATQSVTLRENRPQLVSLGSDWTAACAPARGSVTLDGSASGDPDLQPLTYKWTETSGVPVSLTGAGRSRRGGLIAQATSALSIRPTATAPNVARSVRPTPKSQLFKRRVAPWAPRRPMAMPIAGRELCTKRPRPRDGGRWSTRAGLRDAGAAAQVAVRQDVRRATTILPRALLLVAQGIRGGGRLETSQGERGDIGTAGPDRHSLGGGDPQDAGDE